MFSLIGTELSIWIMDFIIFRYIFECLGFELYLSNRYNTYLHVWCLGRVDLSPLGRLKSVYLFWQWQMRETSDRSFVLIKNVIFVNVDWVEAGGRGGGGRNPGFSSHNFNEKYGVSQSTFECGLIKKLKLSYWDMGTSEGSLPWTNQSLPLHHPSYTRTQIVWPKENHRQMPFKHSVSELNLNLRRKGRWKKRQNCFIWKLFGLVKTFGNNSLGDKRIYTSLIKSENFFIPEISWYFVNVE